MTFTVSQPLPAGERPWQKAYLRYRELERHLTDKDPSGSVFLTLLHAASQGRRVFDRNLREYQAVRLGVNPAVVGVAKTRFVGAPAIPVLRGTSRSPLFVTSAGIPPDEAAARVRQMHGRFRLPTLLKRADSLSRSAREIG